MVLCTAVYLAENKSFAFFGLFFLGDGWSHVILKQLDLGRVCKGMEMGNKSWENRDSGTKHCMLPKQPETSPSILLVTYVIPRSI